MARSGPDPVLESYPTHPVRLIAPSGPGGNPDVLGRLLADKFTTTFGKPFIVENVPGAGGIVAANLVAKVLVNERHASPLQGAADGQVVGHGYCGNRTKLRILPLIGVEANAPSWRRRSTGTLWSGRMVGWTL